MAERVHRTHNTAGLIQLTPLYVVAETRVIPVIRYEAEDELVHTDKHPHCDDETCPCRANIVDGSLVDPDFPDTTTRINQKDPSSISTDCAWCGTGEGVCLAHQQHLSLTSKVLVATGDYLAPGSTPSPQYAWPVIGRTIRGLARTYVRLRRFHAHAKAQRSLRWRLNRAYQIHIQSAGEGES